MNWISYGDRLANGSFDGFVGMLQRREVDIVAADIIPSYEVKLMPYCREKGGYFAIVNGQSLI